MTSDRVSDMWSFRLAAPGTFTKIRAAGPKADHLTEGQVIVRLEAGGLCGSDYTYFKGGKSDSVFTTDPSSYGATLPGASLHEIVGEAVVSRDPDVHPGSHVVGWATAMNGLSEYVVTEGASLAAYDSALTARQAVMIQPLACVIYAVRRIAAANATAAVLGLGPMGLLFAHVLKTCGAAEVVGVDRVDRSDVAKTFGVSEFAHSSVDRWVAGLDLSGRPNVVVEAIGHQITTLTAAITAVAPMGEVYYFGVPDDDVYPIPMVDMLRKDLTLRSGTTWDRRNSLIQADEYLRRHPELIEPYVTHVFPVDDVQQAFEAGVRPVPGQLKIVVEV